MIAVLIDQAGVHQPVGMGLRRQAEIERLPCKLLNRVTVHLRERRVHRLQRVINGVQDRYTPARVLKDLLPLFQPCLGLFLLLQALLADRQDELLAIAHIHADAGGDGFVQGQSDRHDLTGTHVPIERLHQVFEDHQAQDLIVADHLWQGPAAFPALLTVLDCRKAVQALVRAIRLRQAAAQCCQQVHELIAKGFMMDALGVRLFLHRPLAPALDENAGIAGNDETDFRVLLGTNRLGVYRHSASL